MIWLLFTLAFWAGFLDDTDGKDTANSVDRYVRGQKVK